MIYISIYTKVKDAGIAGIAGIALAASLTEQRLYVQLSFTRVTTLYLLISSFLSRVQGYPKPLRVLTRVNLWAPLFFFFRPHLEQHNGYEDGDTKEHRRHSCRPQVFLSQRYYACMMPHVLKRTPFAPPQNTQEPKEYQYGKVCVVFETYGMCGLALCSGINCGKVLVQGIALCCGWP